MGDGFDGKIEIKRANVKKYEETQIDEIIFYSAFAFAYTAILANLVYF